MCNALRVTPQEMRDFVSGKSTSTSTSTPTSAGRNDNESTSTAIVTVAPSISAIDRDRDNVGVGAGAGVSLASNNGNTATIPQVNNKAGPGTTINIASRPNTTLTSCSITKVVNKSNYKPVANPYMKNPYVKSSINVSSTGTSNTSTSSTDAQRQNIPRQENAQQRSNVIGEAPKIQQQGGISNETSIMTSRPQSTGTSIQTPRNSGVNTTTGSIGTIHNPYAKKPPATGGFQANRSTSNTAPNNNIRVHRLPPQQRHNARPVEPRDEALNERISAPAAPIVSVATSSSISTSTFTSSSTANPAQHVRTTTPAPDNGIQVAAAKQQTLGFRQNNPASQVVERNILLRGYQLGPIPLAPGDVSKTWIYPISEKYGEREYQLAISRSAIMNNTLVSLPTGLGKTLIAAVVMYNFYRWFPTGKVVFLAPTRPLVTQQIEACYNIMGIPEAHTAEISGRIKPGDRDRLWRTRRLFFCTPQTFEKDLDDNRVDATMVVCVVLDEAHKATGNYAYVKVLEHLKNAGATARVVRRIVCLESLLLSTAVI